VKTYRINTLGCVDDVPKISFCLEHMVDEEEVDLLGTWKIFHSRNEKNFHNSMKNHLFPVETNRIQT